MKLNLFLNITSIAVFLVMCPTARTADMEPLYRAGLLSDIRLAEQLSLVRIEKTAQVPTTVAGLALVKYTAVKQATIRGAEITDKPFTFLKYKIVGTWHGNLETVNSWSHIPTYPNEGDLLLAALRKEASVVDPESPAREPIDGTTLAWAARVLPDESDAIIRLCNLPMPDLIPGGQIESSQIEAITKLWRDNPDQLVQRHLLDFAAQHPAIIAPLLKLLDPAVALSATQPLDFRSDVVTAFGMLISSDAGPSVGPWLATLTHIAVNRSEDGRLRRHCANAVRMIIAGRLSMIASEDMTMLRAAFEPEESTTMTKTVYTYKFRRNGFGFLPEDRTADLQAIRKEIMNLLSH